MTTEKKYPKNPDSCKHKNVTEYDRCDCCGVIQGWCDDCGADVEKDGYKAKWQQV